MLKPAHLLAGLAFMSFAVAQETQIPLPAFNNTFTGFTRGFWFTCPVDSVLTELRVPNEASQPNQVVEVIDFGTTPPPTFPATATGTTLFYDNQTAAGSWIPANVTLKAGRHYGILGACTASPTSATSHCSYSVASGTYDNDIYGFPITLRRFGTQSGIASNGGGQPCWTENSTISRVEVRVTQEQAPMPGFGSTFTSSLTRGFWFQAPVTCTITGLEVPNESGQSNQVVEVIDFGGSAPPAFPATATGTTLFYDNTAPAGTTIPTSILLRAGRYYGILGACTPSATSATSASSYGSPSGQYNGRVFGIYPFQATRFGTQSGIASNGGGQPCWSESGGAVGRVFVEFGGAGTTSTSSNDFYSQTTGWPAFGVSAPGPLTAIQVGNPTFTVNGPNTAANGVVMGLLNFGIPAAPGSVCLPPAGGSYAGLPPVPACGGTTNMSWDLAPHPLGGFVMFYGILNASGNFSVSIPIPGFAGVFGSAQAYFFDYSVGFAVTEAFNWKIVP